MQITKGVVNKAIKSVIYGPEGVGKSSFAAQYPDPLFIDTEDSTTHMDVARLPKPTSWPMLLSQIEFVFKNRPCQTLVIDTADWAERLCKEFIMSTKKLKSMEDLDYGKAYTILTEEWGRTLNRLQDLVNSGINVVITAHAKLRKFEQPDEMGAYDRWEMKLEKGPAGLTKEWADMLLFANYKTTVITDSKTKSKKGVGGDRMMYTSHHPAWDAKNRFWLDDELPFLYESIAHLIKPIEPSQTALIKPAENIQTVVMPALEEAIPAQIDLIKPAQAIESNIPKALADLMLLNGVKETHLQEAIFRRGYFPKDTPIANLPAEFVNGVLIGAWTQILGYMKSEGIVTDDDVPFN